MEATELECKTQQTSVVPNNTAVPHPVRYVRLEMATAKQDSHTLRTSSSLLPYCYKLDEKDSLGMS